MRLSRIQRQTGETTITGTLELDGAGMCEADTGCGFLNHMLELFAKHARFDLELVCKGDVQVDYHHTVEDTGIVLGRAVSQALGDRVGITRYGSQTLPMDEALVLAAIDIGGRGGFYGSLSFPSGKIGDFDCELVAEFFAAFARELGASVHLRKIAGENCHHIAEAAFKAFARSISAAVEIDIDAPGSIPSTKGTIL